METGLKQRWVSLLQDGVIISGQAYTPFFQTHPASRQFEGFTGLQILIIGSQAPLHTVGVPAGYRQGPPWEEGLKTPPDAPMGHAFCPLSTPWNKAPMGVTFSLLPDGASAQIT